MYPVSHNGTYYENTNFNVYASPKAPVPYMVGMAGASHLGDTDENPAWSAYSTEQWGWLKATFANASALHLEFVANGDGTSLDAAAGDPSVIDDVWITKDL